MGYTTDFYGSFNLDRPLDENQHLYLLKFAEMRHVFKRESVLESMPDELRKNVGLPVGEGGMYYTGDDLEAATIDDIYCPDGVPGKYCQWIPDETGTKIEWDQVEKFYDYIPWLKFIIRHFLQPWGYKLNGSVRWRGERPGDEGTIVVDDNVVTVTRC